MSVTATGYDEEEKRQLKEAVESLKQYNGGLVTETTHLVAPADADNSNKYISAVERGLHIVSPWWLLESASAGRWLEEGPFSGVFRGVVMAATGFAADDRTALRRAVAAGGGRFSEQLVRGRDADADAARFHAQRVTHLVACAPEGPKFEAAKEWGIPVVKVDWVRACARGGSYQPPQHFGFSRKEEGERRAWNSTTIAALPNSAVFAGCRICLVGFDDDDDDDDDDDNSSSRKSHGSTYGGGGGRGGGSGSAHVQEQQQQGNSSSGGTDAAAEQAAAASGPPTPKLTREMMMALDAVEGDAFFCFTNLMAELRDHFCSKLDHTNVGISAKVKKMERLINAKDAEVGRLLTNLKVSPTFYGFRWITLLMTQEWELPDVLRLWDTLLSDPRRFEFLTYFCVATVLSIRNELLQEDDFAFAVKALQRFDARVPMEHLLRSAHILYAQDFPSHTM